MVEGKKENFILTKKQWNKFKSENDKLEKLKKWKLVSAKAKNFKMLYYKGLYTYDIVECDVIGYVDDNEIIIVVNDKLHSIHPDYLLDMQKKDFNCHRENSNLNEDSAEGNLDILSEKYGVEKEQLGSIIQQILELGSSLKKDDIYRFLKSHSLSYEDIQNKKILSHDKWKKKEEEEKRKLAHAKEHIKENIFKGKKIVFTGEMKKTRINMRVAATKYGAITTNTVSRKTDFLIVGKKPGGKLDKAKEYGIATITEEEFWKFIGGKEDALQLAMF